MKARQDTVEIGFCLHCGAPIAADLPSLLRSDPAELSDLVASCTRCADSSAKLLRVPTIPRYQCQYLSTHGNEYGNPFDLTLENVHFFVVAEIYETFFPDAWNGFKEVFKPEDIPPLYEVSVPDRHYRQGFGVDAVLVIVSFVASGIIGGLSYDLLKKKARSLWQRLPEKGRNRSRSLVGNAPYQDGDDFERVFESAHVYLNRRLAGLDALSAPEGCLFKACKYIANRDSVSSRELADHLDCSLDDAKAVLRIMGAEYSMSSKQWAVPASSQSYLRGAPPVPEEQAGSQAEPFFAHAGGSREVAWSLDIPKPPGLSEDEEKDFEVAVMQATTPDTESFLRGKISEQELQQRVYIKAGALAKSYEKRKKGTRSQQKDSLDES